MSMYDNVRSVLHNKWVQALGVLLVLVLAGYLVYLVSPLLVPVFLAMLVAYMLNPVVVFLERRGVRRSVSASALAVLSLIAIIALPVVLVPQVIDEANQLRADAQRASAERAEQGEESFVDRALDWLPLRLFGRVAGLWTDEQARSMSDTEIRARLADWIGSSVNNNIEFVTQRYAGQVTAAVRTGGATLGDFLRYLWDTFVAFLAFLVNFSIFAFATGYLLVSFPSLVSHTRDIIPLQYRKKTLSVVGKIDEQMRSFVRGQVVVALVDAVLYSIGLTISGVPFSIVIGIFAGLISFVPYLGVILGMAPSLLLVLIKYGLDWHIIGVLVTFGVVQTLEEVLLRPLIVGDKIGLHPVWVMSAFLVFGSAFGFAGVLLAVPIAAVLKVLVLEAYDYYRHSKLYDARRA